MSECEVCGYDGAPFLAEIEGAQMYVCKSCLSLGTEIKQPRLIATMKSARNTPKEEVIIADYADVITAARQKKNLTRESLAATLGEKVGIIIRIENSKLRPDEKLARKIERLLQISLYEIEEDIKISLPKRGEHATLGDVASIKGI